MQYRVFRIRFRRRLRKSQRQVEELGTQAEEQLEHNFYDRLSRLKPVRRFIISWLVLAGLLLSITTWELYGLSGYFQSVTPVAGGIYTEGILGDFTTANPMFASNRVDSAVARLIFSGLLTYDDNNHLVGDLAESWTANDIGNEYTVTLKPNLTWQDGKPLTADDVVFTYQVIQNPDARSPLAPGWQGITVTATNARTISFKLPSALAAFPYELTNGIVPKHLLDKVGMSDMRSTGFNTQNPIGAGPFSWKTLQVSGNTPELRQEQIALVPFNGYNRGTPKLASFIVHAFHNQDQLVKSYSRQELTAVAGLSSLPSSLQGTGKTQQNSFIMTAANMVFFRSSNAVLGDQSVRQALVHGANVPEIIKKLDYATKQVTEPVLSGQLGYDPQLKQAEFTPEVAKQQLEQAGWKLSKPGTSVRYKAGQPLQFNLYTANDSEDEMVARLLQQQWLSIGVKADIRALNSDELQQVTTAHAYDALLQGISIGVDPDVYAYWDSAQADVRMAYRPNFSEYKSTTADQALEAGRTRIDPALRIIKYRPFLQSWQQDAPALGLYQPRFLYLSRQKVYGLVPERNLNTDTDRFNNVQNWQINQQAVTHN